MRVKYRWLVTQALNQDAFHLYFLKYEILPGAYATFVYRQDQWVHVENGAQMEPTLTIWGIDIARSDGSIVAAFEDAWKEQVALRGVIERLLAEKCPLEMEPDAV